MKTGKLLRFDEARGYGFIAPDDGGEDVFVHANDIRGDKTQFRAGVQVGFEVEDGDRGLKALDAHLLGQGGSNVVVPVRVTRTMRDGDSSMCDVLSVGDYRYEVTETLLASVPSLTASQITQVRQCVLELAKQHNWTQTA